MKIMKMKNLSNLYLLYRLMIFGFLLITLNACGGLTGRNGVDVNQSKQSLTTLDRWTRISGDREVNQRGVYGTKGIAAGTNKPGARYGSISWTDSKGNLWLFGGESGRNSTRLLNDLWKFDGTYWTWVSGDSKVNQRGVYGTKGVAASTNKPGARYASISWTDSKGNLWLFGGYGYAGTGFLGILNDLWKFDGTNWIWISGDSKIEHRGVYGTKGVAAGTNKPGARYGSISYTDSKGNLWLFGGYGYAGTGFLGILNDLWKFDGKNWTWVSGDSRQNEPGRYGTKGVAASTNKPGARYDSISWTDSKGNLWLFGGQGYNQYRVLVYLNDLWKFDGSNWTWVSGDNKPDRSGVFGTRGVAAGTNKPGARYGSISWVDRKGNLWLFGGFGFASSTITSTLNDMWRFDGTEWTWISGDYETHKHKWLANIANTPKARYDSISWTDSKGNLWLFGGRKGSNDYFNDLWKFEP
jgi:N-acetylneuraminic acid mutarotase